MWGEVVAVVMQQAQVQEWLSNTAALERASLPALMGIPTIVPDGVTSWQLQAWLLGGAPLVRNVGVGTVAIVLLDRSVTGGL